MGSRRQFGRSPGLCAVPLLEYGAIAKSRWPTPAQGDAAGREVGSGMPGSVKGRGWGCAFKSKPPARQLRSQDLLCYYFFGGPGQVWLWGGGYFGRRWWHSPCLGFPGF